MTVWLTEDQYQRLADADPRAAAGRIRAFGGRRSGEVILIDAVGHKLVYTPEQARALLAKSGAARAGSADAPQPTRARSQAKHATKSPSPSSGEGEGAA